MQTRCSRFPPENQWLPSSPGWGGWAPKSCPIHTSGSKRWKDISFPPALLKGSRLSTAILALRLARMNSKVDGCHNVNEVVQCKQDAADFPQRTSDFHLSNTALQVKLRSKDSRSCIWQIKHLGARPAWEFVNQHVSTNFLQVKLQGLDSRPSASPGHPS